MKSYGGLSVRAWGGLDAVNEKPERGDEPMDRVKPEERLGQGSQFNLWPAPGTIKKKLGKRQVERA